MSARATASPATVAAPLATSGAAAAPPLPSIDSLGIDADFTGFFKSDVDSSLRNAALKKLFADPRFNVMDGLDTYIDDYSVFVPLDAEEARGLVQARAILDPPRTRVNDQGHVEPVPPDEPAAAVPAAARRPRRCRRRRTPVAAPRRRGRRASHAAPTPAPVPAPAPAVPEPSAAPSRDPIASRPPR